MGGRCGVFDRWALFRPGIIDQKGARGRSPACVPPSLGAVLALARVMLAGFVLGGGPCGEILYLPEQTSDRRSSSDEQPQSAARRACGSGQAFDRLPAMCAEGAAGFPEPIASGLGPRHRKLLEIAVFCPISANGKRAALGRIPRCRRSGRVCYGRDKRGG